MSGSQCLSCLPLLLDDGALSLSPNQILSEGPARLYCGWMMKVGNIMNPLTLVYKMYLYTVCIHSFILLQI